MTGSTRAQESQTSRSTAAVSTVPATHLRVQGVSANESGFAIWSVDGRIELRDPKGGVVAEIDTDLRGLRDVIATQSGWLVLGSKLSGGEESSAIALIGPRLTIEHVWTSPSLFWSIASHDVVHYASDHRGRVFLLNDTGLVDVNRSQTPDASATNQPAQLRFFGRELVRCTDGSRSINKSTSSICLRDSGPAIEGNWKNAPIACGHWLVADTQDDVRVTSAWRRTVWDAETGQVLTRTAVARPADKLSCAAGALLMDETAPGTAWKLPQLARVGAAVCSSTGKHLAVGSSDVMCIDGAGHVSLHRLRGEK